MSTRPLPTGQRLSSFEQLRYAREIVQQEAQALHRICDGLDNHFCQAADLISNCAGRVILSGMGKAGLIAQKISATLASTGTPSHFLHPAEAVHGDLGRVHADDIVLILSQSGETDEVIQILPALEALNVAILALTGSLDSTLAKRATVTLCLGTLEEAGVLRLAPSTSTTAMLALGDALALVVSHMREFAAEDFARRHPGGSLGRALSLVDDHMRLRTECRIANQQSTIRDVFIAHALPGRRSGATMLVDDSGALAGVFTDSDLARLFERRQEAALDQPISQVMTAQPTTIRAGSRMREAILLIETHKISELPVVDEGRQPVGMIDITDIAGMIRDAPWINEPASTPNTLPRLVIRSPP